MDYDLNILRTLQNLNQLMMLVKKYIEEFYRLSIRCRKNDESLESNDMYVVGTRYYIQYEFIIFYFHSLIEVYQEIFIIEDKL
jgi:hypothetical protein